MKKQSINFGLIEGWLSTIINVVLFILKFWVGMTFGSVAMVADAWHSLSDSLTELVGFIGYWTTKKPADIDHPDRRGRLELIAAVVTATLLTIVGFLFMEQSVIRIRNHEVTEFGLIAVFVFLIATIIKEGLAQFSIWAGKEINSPSLTEEGWHHRSDAVISGLIAAGALVGHFFWWIDGAMGMAVSGMLLLSALNILKEASDSLTGKRPAPEVEQKVKELVSRIAPESAGVHRIRIHHFGDHVEMTLDVRLPAEIDLDAAHEIGHKIESAIKEELTIEAAIHLEPIKSTKD